MSDTISQSQEAAGGGEDVRLILLDPRDNVLVARRRIRAGDDLAIDGKRVAAAQDIPLAHKVARRAIAPGETVLKYGAPIGSATASIAPGEHVHVHNIKSEYTPTYTLDDPKLGATA
ncbi:UxaA family hydrolase [Alsobacter sp. KACC 23698]|uniref:UxaA family hydrolase n=1 Tax=Alsobacter sp. KACC 23698 TaxID=3149229 RepID=A0AAU7JFU8_9HYPH